MLICRLIKCMLMGAGVTAAIAVGSAAGLAVPAGQAADHGAAAAGPDGTIVLVQSSPQPEKPAKPKKEKLRKMAPCGPGLSPCPVIKASPCGPGMNPC